MRANTLMSDPGASVPPPIVSNTSPPTANDAAEAVTPEKAKPPRPAEPRSNPFCKRALEESEVDTAQSRARPARELRPTMCLVPACAPAGAGNCSAPRRRQGAAPSPREELRLALLPGDVRRLSRWLSNVGGSSSMCNLLQEPRLLALLLRFSPCLLVAKKRRPRPLLARRRLHVACLVGSSRPAAAALVLRTEHAAQGRATCVY